ncbi:hypothetical protein C0Q70_03722 [Pomacea canaliculata]|uniref:Uncharacterized protein n=1 Tax=Pomacea canaliculata TaxID=400727 RepID=A0A2T7PTI3_POMCA|nr:hypothetical protein C0Q70_03722 [Pomacea canaliculata]
MSGPDRCCIKTSTRVQLAVTQPPLLTQRSTPPHHRQPPPRHQHLAVDPAHVRRSNTSGYAVHRKPKVRHHHGGASASLRHSTTPRQHDSSDATPPQVLLRVVPVQLAVTGTLVADFLQACQGSVSHATSG